MPQSAPLVWDIFCRVIDNHGDLGVCWRLSRDLAARGQQVRLWVDDVSALHWMAPGALQGAERGVRVLPWTQPIAPALLAALPASDVWVEAFGCEIAAEFIAACADSEGARGRFDPKNRGLKAPVWINLEYLSAEPWVERMHALPSPVLHGPAAGRTKWFFYPGFSAGTGGLLREVDLAARQQAFDRAAWLRQQRIEWAGEQLISLFCYEPPPLCALLRQLQAGREDTRLLVTAGRAARATQECIQDQIGPQRPSAQRGQLSISYLPALTQRAYDELLWSCHLNFVRGEDSLVRALWAGQPLVWQIYPQPEDNAHHAKLDAFLDWLAAPAPLRRFHRVWNGIELGPLPALDLAEWRLCVQAARARLLGQADLASQLLRLVADKR